MSRKRHKPEEMIAKLRQVDVLTAQGTPVADAVRSIGVTEVRSSSKAGDGTTIRSGPMPRWATNLPLRRCSCRPSPPGRLRWLNRLRRTGSP